LKSLLVGFLLTLLVGNASSAATYTFNDSVRVPRLHTDKDFSFTLQVTTSDQTDGLTISYANQTYTTIWVNESAVDPFTNRTLLFFVNATAAENRSYRFPIVFQNDAGTNYTFYISTRIRNYRPMFDDIADTAAMQGGELLGPWWYERLSMINNAGTSPIAHYDALSFLIQGNLSTEADDFATKIRAWIPSQSFVAGYNALKNANYAMGYLMISSNGGFDDATDEELRIKTATTCQGVYAKTGQESHGIDDSSYISFADYSGKMWPSACMCGIYFHDYTNDSFQYDPERWLDACDYGMFVDDTQHDVGYGSMWNVEITPGGLTRAGSYEDYYTKWFIWWFYEYSHYKGQSITEIYPETLDFILNRVRYSHPTGYSPSWTADGANLYVHTKSYAGLVDNTTIKGWLLGFGEDSAAELASPRLTGTQPHITQMDTPIIYMKWENDTTSPRGYPSDYTYFVDGAYAQVIRGWGDNASYLSLRTFNASPSGSWRDMSHGDDFHVGYASRADIPLADGGEIKKTLSEYGGALTHNSVFYSRENEGEMKQRLRASSLYNTVVHSPLTNSLDAEPFATAETTSVITSIGSPTSAGLQYVVDPPISATRAILTPGIEDYGVIIDFDNNTLQRQRSTQFLFTTLNMSPTNSFINTSQNADPTSFCEVRNDKNCSKGFLFSGAQDAYAVFRTHISKANQTNSGDVDIYVNDNYAGTYDADDVSNYYFIYDINTTFFNKDGWNTVIYSTDDVDLVTYTAASAYPQVNYGTTFFIFGRTVETFTMDGTSYDPVIEDELGVYTSRGNHMLIERNSTNMNGDNVFHNFIHVPIKDMHTKMCIDRVGGYATQNEVMHPCVIFVQNDTNPGFGISAFSTQFDQSNLPVFTNVTVTGTGTALHVESVNGTDIITVGDGTYLTADHIGVEASYSFLRNTSNTIIETVYVRNSDNITFDGTEQYWSNETVASIYMKKSGNNLTIIARTETSPRINFATPCDADTSIKKDGILLSKGSVWDCVDANNLYIDAEVGDELTYLINNPSAEGVIAPTIISCTLNTTTFTAGDKILANLSIQNGTYDIATAWATAGGISHLTNAGNGSDYYWFNIDTTGLSGTNTVISYVNDTNGTSGSRACSSITDDDATYPTCTFSSPIDGILLSPANLSFVAEVDNATNVSFNVNGNWYHNITGGVGNFSVNTPGILGTVTWYVKACDQADNCNTTGNYTLTGVAI